jgi:S-DNA-T family DNA segregation ATPase FtsK/SpoIIIE
MARKQSPGRSTWIKRLLALLRPVQPEVVGLVLLTLGILTLLALFSVTSGALSDRWALALRLLLGWGAYPLAVAVALVGTMLLLGRPRLTLPLESFIGLELLFAAGLALLHLLSFPKDPLTLAGAGGGGGYIGWALSTLLADAVGPVPTFFIVGAFFVGGLVLALRPAWSDLVQFIRPYVRGQTSVQPTTPQAAEPTPPRPTAKKPAPPPPSAAPCTRSTAEGVRVQAAPPTGSPGPARRSRDSRLPPLDLLRAPVTEASGGADVRYQAQVIEETLEGFGVPVHVVEINRGPAVTQFGVEPGYIIQRGLDGGLHRRKVRVSMVSALVNDLALALAASPIRIEAPVPGRPLIGIEVPNSEVSLVALRSVMESDAFRRHKGVLKVALGLNISGEPAVADLAAMPHLLIAGATGSGKSVCINSITSCFLCNHLPEELQLLMIDPKMVELTNYNGIPHLLAPVVVELDQVVKALAWAMHEMDNRYRSFAEAEARNIAEYNRKVGRQSQERLPYIVIIIDELADLMMAAPEEVERYICRIAQMARATGIHLVIATQRPSVDVVTGLIKANFPARISFAVTSQVDSRVILDTGGAEQLLGRGDMLYMAPDSAGLLRLQGCFVSDQEISALVRWWRQMADALPADYEVPWADLLEDAEEEEDELLDEAIALVREHGHASISFLQRRLRIGYPRAARLIDLMEEQGIIGPDEGGGRSREVLMEDDVGG